MTSEQGEPVEEVLRKIHERDPDLDMGKFQKGQFKRWRDRGLLPRPIRRPGRGKTRGKGAIYPAGTTAQLLRLLEIRAESGRFNPERALWRLWWEGWPVDPQIIHARLDATLEAEAIPDEPGAEHLSPLLRTLRKRAGVAGFVELAELLNRLYTSSAIADWRMKSALPIFYRAGGVEKLRGAVAQDDMPDFGRATANLVPVAESNRRLGAATSQTALRNAIAVNPDIEQARRDLQTVITSAQSVWSVVARFLPESNAIRDLIAHYGKHAWEALPYAVIYALALRRVPAYAAVFEELSKHSDLATELRRAIEIEDSTGIKKRPGADATARGTAKRGQSQCTTILASPSPPPDRDTVSSP